MRTIKNLNAANSHSVDVNNNDVANSHSVDTVNNDVANSHSVDVVNNDVANSHSVDVNNNDVANSHSVDTNNDDVQTSYSDVIKPGDDDYIDLSDVKMMTVNPVNTKSQGCINIVISCNGKRVKLSNDLVKDIGSPKKVDIAFKNDKIILIPNGNGIFCLKPGNIIYSSELAHKIAEVFNLDFTGRTSITTGQYHLQSAGNGIVAVIGI